MRHGLLAAALLLAGLAPAARAADLPPVVLQIAPPGKLLDDARTVARTVGGEDAVKKLNDSLKEKLGDKGLSGLDLQKPVVFGIYFRPNAEKGKESFGYGAAAVTDEKDFLALLGKAGDVAPVDGKKGLYRITDKGKPDDAKPGYLRLVDGVAYVSIEMTADEFDPAKFPAYEKLVVAGEAAPLSARVYVERFPAELQQQFAAGLGGFLEGLDNAPVPPDAEKGVKEFTLQAKELMKRYTVQLKESNEAVVRVLLDPATAETSLELGLVGKPGSSLAKDIAARKPTTNKFAGVVGTGTVVGFKTRLPLFTPELREGVAAAFGAGLKQGLGTAPPPAKALLTELSDGLVRTIKGGEFDLVGAINGPDKDDHFTAVTAVAFDDTKKLEAEFRKLYTQEAPPQAKELVTLDADKANGVAIHTAKVGGFTPPDVQKLFGGDAVLAFAFAPNGLLVAFGPDPVPALKAALAAKPEAARVLDVVVNPARLAKLAAATGGEAAGAKAAEMLGTADKPSSAFFLAVDGGAELKVRVGFNLKLVSRVGVGSPPVPR